MSNTIDGDGTAPKALPEDTSEIGEDGVPLSPNNTGVQFTSPAKDNNGDAKVELGGVGGVPQFVGLGKEELMRYAHDPFWVRLRWFLFILFWVIWVAMLATAIAIIVLAPKCTSSDKIATHLVNNGPYYQISMKSLSDAGDKFGGLKSHLDYINELGVRTVILSEFQNPKNLKEVDPDIGTNETFKQLIDAFREKKIRVLLQLGVNHGSMDHPWFQSNPDYYVIEDTAKVNESTWKSLDGNKLAWRPLGDGSKSYLHIFRESEPDYNYKNEKFITEMNGVLHHWFNFDNNIFGFLLSDVSYLMEDLDNLKDEKAVINQKANKDVLLKLLDSSKWEIGTRILPYALLDVDGLDGAKSMELYTSDQTIPILKDLASIPKNFTPGDLKQHADSIKNHFVIRRLSGPRMNRITTVFPPERADILSMIAYTLRGEVVVYYGDEIGLGSGNAEVSSTLDINLEPMKWSSDSLQTKRLDFYKCLGQVHLSINQSESKNDADTVYYDKDNVFAFKRKNYVVVANLKDSEAELDLNVPFKDIVNGTIRCGTPNIIITKEDKFLANLFKASPNSGYVLMFDGKKAE